MTAQDSMTQPAPSPQDAPIRLPLPPATSLYHPAVELTRLRQSRPVAEVTFGDGRTAWLVTRFADVRQVLVDPRFSRAAAVAPDGETSGLATLAADSLLGMDPPEHTRLRRLVASAFTARRVEALRPKVTGLVDELLAKMADLPRPVDLVTNFSLPLPVRVICELLGVPATDQHLFHGWSDTMMSGEGGDPTEIQAAMGNLVNYLGVLIAAKRTEPGDDLMTALIAARDEQDRLSERELVSLCLAVLIGGHETTANQINMILLTLLRFPEEFDRLRTAPETIPQALEELMRFVQLGDGAASLPRVATEEVVLSGVTIPAGAMVLPGLGAANRDPAVCPEPDRLDVTRTEVQHLGFGAGVHHCLGAQLARMELQEALRGLLRHMPGLRVTVPDAQLRFKPGMILRSLEALPVTW
jgi:cytochrome P450